MRGARLTPELVLRGRIATLAGAAGLGWTEAIAVRDGRVVAAGPADAIEALAGPQTRQLALGPGLVILPGLTDAHLHLADAAAASDQVDLSGSPTLAEGLSLVAAAHLALPAGRWLEGRGWDPTRWGGWPTASDLENVAPRRAVALWAHDHHALWASHAALRAAGVDRDTPDPAGGTIRRTAAGGPEGCLHENAATIVAARAPRPSSEVLAGMIERYARQLIALGLVAAHDPGDMAPDADLSGGLAAYRTLADQDRLPIRVHASIRAPALDRAIDQGLRTGQSLGDDPRGRARMGWLKLFADGSLGSRTAALLDPYEAEPGFDTDSGGKGRRGITVTSEGLLTALVARAAAAGIVGQIHAIGDAALRSALAALEPVAPRSGPMARVEHVQFADPGDLPRFARARIAASVQPCHLASDADTARRAWARRAEVRGFPLRGLIASRAVLVFGTDAPVEAVDPWPGIAIAVTRTGEAWAARKPFGPRQRVTVAQAIRAATIGPAIAAGELDRGRLVPGHRADFIAVPADALDEPVTPGGPLGHARPVLVAVDGRVVFER